MRADDIVARNFDRDAFDDLVLLENLNIDAVMKNLRARYERDLIHTYIGDVLVIVNPFKNIAGIYSPEVFEQYHDTFMHETAPHSFSIAQAAYAAIERGDPNQCIVITGESGAGKTETAKRILHYLATVSGSGTAIQKVQSQILASNPVLEAFGNAQTLRNDNSSRFGKYVQVYLDQSDHRPVGAAIQTFLLEKSRVVVPLDGERNFYIFYQMIAGMPEERRQQLQLRSTASSYRLLANKGLRDTAKQDAALFKETMSGLNVCGMSAERQDQIFHLLSAILQLGEVEFAPKGDDVDASVIVDDAPVRIAAELLAVQMDQLKACLVSRKYKTGSEKLTRNLSPSAARNARDALAKLLYERAFKLVVTDLNHAMKIEHTHHELKHISVLDVFGFEVHEKDPNSLEQLLINYFNEKLHKMFIDRTLRLEQEEYRRENIEWTPLEYFDNSVVCELIDRNPKCIFGFIEECQLLNCKDDELILKRLVENFSDHKHFERVVERHVPSHTDFVVKHYAGDVRYNVTSFLEKNADFAWADLHELGASSRHEVLRQMFPVVHEEAAKKRPPSAAIQFKTQVQTLVGTMSACVAHYIRCVKPNHEKKAGVLDDAFVRHQAKYLSILENVRLRRAGFAFRMTFGDFMHRYSMVSPNTWPVFEGDKSEGCRQVLQSIGIANTGFQIGKTKVFIKEPTTLFALENKRSQRLPEIVSKVKAFWKGAKTRRWFKRVMAARRIQRRWREHTRAERALRYRSAIKIQRAVRATIERRWRATLRQRATRMLSGKKHRRICSVQRFFVGNYLPELSATTTFRQIMHSHNENIEETFFFDEARKFRSRNGHLIDCFVLVTSSALYVLEYSDLCKKQGSQKTNPELVVRKRWPLEEVAQLTLSGRADNFVVVLMDTCAEGVKDRHDMCFEMERKTEFLAFISSRFMDKMQKDLPVAVGDRIVFGSNRLRRLRLSFKDAKHPQKEGARLKWGGFRRYQVVVGNIPISPAYQNEQRGTVVGRVA